MNGYNIYLQSPQLAYQANQRKQLLKIIEIQNKRNQQLTLKRYTPQYFRTAYSRFFISSQSSGAPY
jgi:hypothetical protein